MSYPAPALVVIAKAPVPGRSKTRLCPPLDPVQAAGLAQAALLDTLEVIAATPASRHVLVLAGEPGGWMPGGFEVLPQAAGDLGVRLAGAFADIAGPALLIGMDTPQVTPALLSAGLALLCERGNDAVLGLTPDGGYWAIGLRRADARVFLGVPMSTARTGEIQRERLDALGLRTARLPRLRDVDDYADALAVAAGAPATRFARALATVARELSRSAA